MGKRGDSHIGWLGLKIFSSDLALVQVSLRLVVLTIKVTTNQNNTTVNLERTNFELLL